MAEIAFSLHNKQSIAFTSKATEILYGGAAGGGKSHLMRVAAIAWCFTIPKLQVYIFRRLSDDLVKNHMEGTSGFLQLLAPWSANRRIVKINHSNNTIEFQNGSKIFLCHCQYEKDMYKYQGAEMHVLLIDELTHFTESIYKYLRGRVRMTGVNIPKEYSNMFPRIMCGSNPGGIGHNFVKKSFVDIAPPLEIVEMQKSDGGMRRQFIPALLEDNPSLLESDPDYESRLDGLGRPELVRAMRYGDWNIVDGGAFDDIWNSKILVVPRFKVPSTWRVDRSMDWGSSHPFSVGWWAESNGEEATLPNGKTFTPKAGSLIQIFEWYGAKTIGENKGVKMSATDVGIGVKERDNALLLAGWVGKLPLAGAADNSIRDVREIDVDTIEKKMADVGTRWESSDKSAGSRRNGLQLMRDRMQASIKGEGAGLYFMDCCRASIATIPTLPRDKNNSEDVDTKSEDHAYDMVRYRILKSNNRAAKNITFRFPS